MSDEDDAMTPLGWWTIKGEALLDALHRVAAGEHPDIVYAELYANSDHEHDEVE
jgi:hypothetical protein